jgi:hypothetical protein
MKNRLSGLRTTLLAGVSFLVFLQLSPSVAASTAYGTLNNFDCVNDTGVEAHGFEIELVDCRSTDITYTYDYNHYGIPKITEDTSDPAHPRVFVRYAATRNADGSWTAYTAIPAGPISPTDGHQFTNPSVNFGGEHFGVGYYGNPTAVKYNWLIDDGRGNLVHGPPVYVATPTFTYYPPNPAQPLPVVQAVIVPPPPPAPPVLQWFGVATWVKDIKTTSHNAGKVELRDLVDPDPDDPLAPNWTNGEPAEVETEWRILQTDFKDAANPKGELAGLPEELPDGDEVVTRRYEFYKYIGPIDAESGEAMADAVGPDGIHGTGTVTYNHHIGPDGEWVKVTVDLSTVEVVGEFFGAQMAGFDRAPALGLIDHIPDGELNVAYAERAVVIAGGEKVTATISSGSLPPGTMLEETKGIFSGTPTAPGVFTFMVNAVLDRTGDSVAKAYSVTIPGNAPGLRTITTSASPALGGSTSGGGQFVDGTPITVVAAHSPGYAFIVWTEDGWPVSYSEVYPFTVNGDRVLVASFEPVYTVATSASPGAGGTTSGDGAYFNGASVTVVATPNAGYSFVNWTEGGVVVSVAASYTFTANPSRTLVANFARITHSISTSASPSQGGSTSGSGIYKSGDSVTVIATANAGYTFVAWTEGATAVSALASYTFTASASRSLVANFAPLPPSLEIVSAGPAIRNGSKIDVPITVRNGGGTTAEAVVIDSKKLATLDGKATSERMPITLGAIAPGDLATAHLSFNGIKAGTRTLQITLIYMGGSATFSAPVTVP